MEPTVKFIIGGRGVSSLSRVKVGIEESTDDGATTHRTRVRGIGQVKCALKFFFVPHFPTPISPFSIVSRYGVTHLCF